MKVISYRRSAVTNVKWILCGMFLTGGLGIGLTSQAGRVQANGARTFINLRS
jgi:hypothetical protein